MNKSIDLKVLASNIKILQKKGVSTVISLIVGYYGETEDTLALTVRYLEDLQPDLVKINIWGPLPEENSFPLAQQNRFTYNRGLWQHDTMCFEQACDLATRYFHKNSSLTVLPPNTSVFDQWPQLVAAGLTVDEIVRIFQQYHCRISGCCP